MQGPPKAGTMDVDRTELAAGLHRTRRYLLAHHEPEEYHKCWQITIRHKQVHLCSRCTGIYPGIAAALLTWWFLPHLVPEVVGVAVLPLPALLDWTVTTYTEWDGWNVARTATGVALGAGYGFGLGYLAAGDLTVLTIGVGYAVLATLLLIPVVRRASGNS